MAGKVGPKGQVVIEKAIRDRLGVGAGWLTIQRLVNGHVELFFVPPEHNRSLAGSLAKYVKGRHISDEDWPSVKEAAWEAAVREDWGDFEEQTRKESAK